MSQLYIEATYFSLSLHCRLLDSSRPYLLPQLLQSPTNCCPDFFLALLLSILYTTSRSGLSKVSDHCLSKGSSMSLPFLNPFNGFSTYLDENLNSLYGGPTTSGSGLALHHDLIPLPLFSMLQTQAFFTGYTWSACIYSHCWILRPQQPILWPQLLILLVPSLLLQSLLMSSRPWLFPDPQCIHPSTCTSFLSSQDNIEKIIQPRKLVPLSDMIFGLDSAQHTLRQSYSRPKTDPRSSPS